MIDAAVIGLRLLQYLTGSILMGSALFFLYGLPRGPPPRWARPLVIPAALGLAVSSALGLGAQTILLAGSVDLGLDPESLQAMLGIGLGQAALVRTGAALLAALALWLAPHRAGLALAAALGGIGVASFAWMGHGAASEGPGAGLHLVADILHALTAATWLGALAAFAIMVRSAERSALLFALRRFSAIGVPLVAALAATGLLNSWFLVGPEHLAELFTTPYGRLLLLKLALFAGMLGLAARNRWQHTAEVAEGGTSAPVLRSLTTEALLGLLVLGLVAWFGMLEPPGLA